MLELKLNPNSTFTAITMNHAGKDLRGYANESFTPAHGVLLLIRRSFKDYRLKRFVFCMVRPLARIISLGMLIMLKNFRLSTRKVKGIHSITYEERLQKLDLFDGDQALAYPSLHQK